MTSQLSPAILLTALALPLVGCGDEPTVGTEGLNNTEVRFAGEMALRLPDSDATLNLRTQMSPFALTAGREQNCILSNQPQTDDRPWLLCDSLYLIGGEREVEARLSSQYTSSEPICGVWTRFVGPDVPEDLCFPAGAYDGSASDPSVRLRVKDQAGDHPFAVADLIDEATSELIGLTTFEGRVVSSVRWHVYYDDFGALQLQVGYEGGGESPSCYSSSAPRILDEDGNLDPVGAVDDYAELLRTEADHLCTDIEE